MRDAAGFRSTVARARAVASCGALLVLLVAPDAGAQPQISHKGLGGSGLEAGSQADRGLYTINQLLLYDAHEVRDRNGSALPVGLDAHAGAVVFGASATFEVTALHTYASAAFEVPVAWSHVNTEIPQASLDRLGLGDLYVQPLLLGWKLGRADVVAGYAFYVPTGQREPGGQGGIGRGQWSHEPSLGGTLFLDDRRGWSVSALASLNFNATKRGIDITEGTTLQVQGGAGTTIARIVEAGVAAFGLWQVTDDSGSALPAPLRGARDRVYGLGPEVDVKIPPLRTTATFRYEHEFLVRSRPEGQVFFVALTLLAWKTPPI
jgi:hypothetical protein